MPKNRLSDKSRGMWCAEMAVAKEFYRKRIEPTEKYANATKNNDEHWVGSNWNTRYPRVTANYMYANLQATLPRVLLREPRVIVKPSTRMTRAYMRAGEVGPNGQPITPVDRWVAAAVCQQIANWRIREFDFTKQVRRAVRDDWARGMGRIRHGYIAEGDKVLTRQGGPIEFENHTHLREGWPFAVHQPIKYTLWDPKARDNDERQWVAFGKLWRREDLKQWLGIRRDLPITDWVGKGLNNTSEWDSTVEQMGDYMGFTCCWEIWDRREHEVIYWLGDQEEDLKVVPWPLEFEDLPDSVLCSNESNEEPEPISEPEILWDLQQELNQMISLVLVYAKRGVPIIGINKNILDDPDDADKIIDAEILEAILFKDEPIKALQLLNVNPVPQTLLLAIQEVKNLMREVGSISSFERGTRENVETATEAARIGQGGDLRQAMRAEAIRDFFGAVVRKDWQVLQQTTTDDQIVDVAAEGPMVLQVRATKQQIQMEYDFEIAVGSTEPPNRRQERIDALAFMQALQADPQVYRQVNPRFLATQLCRAFNMDENEVLASVDAAQHQILADALAQQLGNGELGKAAAGRMAPGAGASLDALKSGQDNKSAAQYQ